MGRTTTSSSSDLHLASLLDFRLQVVHKIEDTGVPGRVQYQIEDIFIIHYSLFMPNNNGGASEASRSYGGGYIDVPGFVLDVVSR